MAELLTRRNTVLEALRAQRRKLYKLWLQEGSQPKLVRPLENLARQQGVPVVWANKQKLSELTQTGDHQGVVLEVGGYPYVSVGEMLNTAVAASEPPFLLLLDLIQGPQNVGTLLRTAESCGVHGIIMQERRAPEITPLIVQHSAGAAEHLRIAQVTNLVQTIKELQAQDVWVAGLDFGTDAVAPSQIDLHRPLAIVVGHEGDGLRRLVRDSCDFIVELPMRGRVESLNAAVAGSVMLYLAWQARGFIGKKS
jgi:23S rRNA (guanosine2251-2'-O)-methyltransferase